MQGNALLEQARSKAGEEADALFRQAGEKYADALKIKPDMHEALYDWGLVFSHQARSKAGEEADALFRQAGEKYADALKIKPDMHEALNNWGSMFAAWSAKKEGAEAERMLREAKDKLLQAEKLKTGSASYNLACVAARRSDKEQCLSFLKRAKEYETLPDREHLLSDPDLVSIRDEPWFREFLAGL